MKEPKLQDFNLTGEKLKKIHFVQFVLKSFFYCVYALVSFAIGFLIFPVRWTYENIFQIGGIFVIAVVIYLMFSILFSTRILAIIVSRMFFRDYAAYERQKAKFNRWVHRTRTDYWYHLSDAELAREVLEIFQERGDNPKIKATRYDQSTDILLKDRTIVRTIARKSPLSLLTIKELYVALEHIDVDSAILIATGGISWDVLEFIEGKPLSVMGIAELIKLNSEL